MINYSDLHKVYNQNLYTLPAIGQTEPLPEEEVVEEVRVKTVVVEREPTYYPEDPPEFRNYDNPMRDLVTTAAGYAFGIALGRWLSIFR